jgi:solute carrier family 35 protein E1
MPHSHSASISTGSHARAASQSRASTAHTEVEKFPDFDAGHVFPNTQPTSQRWPQQNGHTKGNGSVSHSDRWHAARRDSRVRWAPRGGDALSAGPGHHRRQSSVANAVHRMRSASMSQNAHEIAEALRAPVSWKLIVRPAP